MVSMSIYSQCILCAIQPKMPVGIPKFVKFTPTNQPSLDYMYTFFGFICCTIRPTQYLFHPIIGQTSKESKKFEFTLETYQDIVITSAELQVALRNGYVVDNVLQVLEFDAHQDLFKSYVRKFIQKKME